MKKVLKRGRPGQLKKLRKAYHGKRLKKWWSSYASWECCTIVELKDAEHVGHRMKGGHTHNHVKNAHERMRRCRICDNPITKYEGFKSPWYGHICLDCYFEECEEEAYMCGIPFGGKRSDNFYRDFIRRARKK